MKLIVQIPCYNEEDTIAQTIADIPRNILGIDTVEVLIISDGCTDNTIEAALAAGAEHTISFKSNQGLARAFSAGLDACLSLGADIIVNTDADNQYYGGDIPVLIAPILEGRADLVIGDRQTQTIEHFSPLKKALQWLGSSVVRKLSGTKVQDTVSGFRAYSKEAAIKLNVLSNFSHTIETIIQASRRNLTIASVPIQTNPVLRESRLFKSIPHFIRNSLITMVRVYAMYKPLRVFFFTGLFFFILGAIPIIRFLYFYFQGGGQGHVQSLLLGSMFVLIAVFAWLIGLVADLMSFNRQLQELTLERVKRLELECLNKEQPTASLVDQKINVDSHGTE